MGIIGRSVQSCGSCLKIHMVEMKLNISLLFFSFSCFLDLHHLRLPIWLCPAVPCQVSCHQVDNTRASSPACQPLPLPARPAGCKPRKLSRWPRHHKSTTWKNTQLSHTYFFFSLDQNVSQAWVLHRADWKLERDLHPVWHCPQAFICAQVSLTTQMRSSSYSLYSTQQTALWSALCGLLRWRLNMISFQGKRFVFSAPLAQRATLFLSSYPTLTPHSRFWVTWSIVAQTSGAGFFFSFYFFWVKARNIV